MKPKVYFMLLVALIFAVSMAVEVKAAEKEIMIGFMSDFTGPLAEHGVAGKQGAILALEEINYTFAGRPIKFIIEDEASDPAVAMDKARKLVETDKVCMILGPFHGGCGGAVAGYVNKIKIPNVAYWYSISNDAIMGVNWTWAPFGTLSSVAYPTGAYAYEKLGYRTFSTMGTDYVAGREFIGGARAAFEERGGKIIQEQWIPLGTKDVSPYITSLKEADAVLAWFMGVTVIPGLKQLKEFRVKMPVLMPQSGHSTNPKIMNEMGDDCVGIITSDAYAQTIDTPENKKFVDAYQKRWGELPAGVAYGGYSVIQIALAALKKTGGDTSPAALAKALDATKVPGILGNFAFGETRVGVGHCVTYNHKKVDNKIITDVLGRSSVATKRVGNKLVHSLASKSWGK
jgi:branched-chain amino acid transport system substrate-binding protein